MLAAGGVAYADGNGWGLVPGLRIGSVHGSFDGTAAMPDAQASWGHTTELHLDLLKTFGDDRRMYGVSLGYLSQSNDGWVVAAPADAHTFDHTGVSLTAILGTVIGGQNSASLRAGVVSGRTTTLPGPIEGALWRVGGEVTHVSTIGWLDLATHVAVEYFTGGKDDRHYHALAIVLGETVALAFW